MAQSRQRIIRRQPSNEHHDERFQHELKEMQETHDLRDIDDDVEDVATLFEWYAEEHNHQPKSPTWFIILAVGTTILVGIFLFNANFIGAIATGFLGAILYHFAQREPKTVRYRAMVDGVALNNTLYHYKELAAFNIVYEPNHTKTVILRSKRQFAPLLHMEIGDTDPVLIRNVLLEFLPEDQTLEEPFADILARRLGF
jgi:hypothetical protein